MQPAQPTTSTAHCATSPAEAPPRPRVLFVVTQGRADPPLREGLNTLGRLAAREGVELVLPPEERGKHDLDALHCRWREGDGDGADLAVALGGDGTTLRALGRFVGSRTPVFAINYGRVGFLTTASAQGLESAVERALRGDFRIDQLTTLDVRRGGERLGLAVNDAVVTSDVHGRMALLRWTVETVEMGEIGCDAMVVSTPTGSTAYNLSAGGPVIGWGLEALAVTFVAPHSLMVRSLVLPRGHCVTIANMSPSLDARVVIDGHLEHSALAYGEDVQIEIAAERVLLARLPEVTFLGRYRDTFAV